MKKVLIAEDDTLLQSILIKSFVNAGFDAHGANDGFAAEVEIKAWHPEILILDLLMPNEDGFGVLRTIRSDSDTAKTEVIVLSNLSEAKTVAEVKKFGVSDYFVKASTTPSEIVAFVKKKFG